MRMSLSPISESLRTGCTYFWVANLISCLMHMSMSVTAADKEIMVDKGGLERKVDRRQGSENKRS